MGGAGAEVAEQRSSGGWVEPGLAGELGAKPVSGEFGLGGAAPVVQVVMGDLVTGEQGEFVAGQPNRCCVGEHDSAARAPASDLAAGLHCKGGQARSGGSVRGVGGACGQTRAGDTRGDFQILRRRRDASSQYQQEKYRHVAPLFLKQQIIVTWPWFS